jgi:hypothetical protein
MKWITRASLIPLIVAFVAQVAWAGGHSSRGGTVHVRGYHLSNGGHSSRSGTLHVRGYYRNNGTYVHAYNRAAPRTAVSATAPMPSFPRAIPRAIPVATTASSTKTTRSFYSGSTPKFSSSLGVPRDSHGRIQRSEAAKHEFMRTSGYPHGRPGYIVDHIVPLKRGGCDCPSNMQWQTIQDAKAKDKWE